MAIKNLKMKSALKKGYVQVYTGDGKGKTSAALGLIIRACGAGLKVYAAQFLKKGVSCELKTLKKRFPDVTIKQFGSGKFIRKTPSPEDIKLARNGLKKLHTAMTSGQYDIIIADEINCAVSVGLFPVKDVLELIDQKPDGVELVLTGRNAHKLVIQHADLVTEMKKIKHYYDNGAVARSGIEM